MKPTPKTRKRRKTTTRSKKKDPIFVDGKRPRPDVGVVARDCGHLVDGGPGLAVLGKLQVGIDHVVHRVQLVVRLVAGLRGTRRGGVGGDRLLLV